MFRQWIEIVALKFFHSVRLHGIRLFSRRIIAQTSKAFDLEINFYAEDAILTSRFSRDSNLKRNSHPRD
jgi:hypothetical protein